MDTLAENVDKSNFKTWRQVGFCRRQRDFKPKRTEFYEVHPDSIKSNKSQVSGELHCKRIDERLSFHLTKLVGPTFRLKINEVCLLSPRYEIPIGDVLVTEPKVEDMCVQIDRSHGKVTVHGTHDDAKAIIHLKPFRIDFFLKDRCLVVVNGQGLLMVEHLRKRKTDSGESTGSHPRRHRLSSRGSGQHDVEGMWEETFNDHVDSKPFGPSSVGVDFEFTNSEHVYGLPEHADAFQLRDTLKDNRGPYRLYNLDVFGYNLDSRLGLYGSVPLIWAHSCKSSAGVFWHNASETWIDVNRVRDSDGRRRSTRRGAESDSASKTETHWWSESGIIDSFVMLGERPADVVRLYGELTGTTPLPPLFALGYHQCRWNYMNEAELLDVSAGFDEHSIPCDTVWLDIEHTREKRYLTWDSGKFPDPEGMVDKLAERGRKLVTIVDPHIKKDDHWDIYKEARDQRFFVQWRSGDELVGKCWPEDSCWVDFSNPDARAWWAKLFVTQPGGRPDNTFGWNDMNEPSVFSGPEMTLPKDALQHGGWEHRDLHNLYGLHCHLATWNGQLLRSSNKERPFLLTRAFFAGSQRTSAVWTGDNLAEWPYLYSSTRMLLNLSMAGITLCGADVGGFFGEPGPELLTRWFQAGAVQPFFRGHAHMETRRREPWCLPSENVEIVRTAIRLRYRMLPYWYTLFYESETSNAPVMAPLWFHFPTDEGAFDLEEGHMIGPAVLAWPVTHGGATHVRVYFPGDESSIWYSHDQWKSYSGGATVEISVTLATMPLYYRGGWIVPHGQPTQRKVDDPLTLIVALDRHSRAQGTLYLDDGHSMSYKEGDMAYFSLAFTPEKGHGELRVRKRAEMQESVPTNYRPPIERVLVIGQRYRPVNVSLFGSEEIGQSRPFEFSSSAAQRLVDIRCCELFVEDDWMLKIDWNEKDEW